LLSASNSIVVTTIPSYLQMLNGTKPQSQKMSIRHSKFMTVPMVMLT
jgi:hypothetical protein